MNKRCYCTQLTLLQRWQREGIFAKSFVIKAQDKQKFLLKLLPIAYSSSLTC